MANSNIGNTVAPPGVMHLATRQCVELLKKGPIGASITYSEIGTTTGMDCSAKNQKGYGYLKSAINHVVNNYGFVWERFAGVGVRCLDARGCKESSERVRRGLNKKVCREVRKVQTYALDSMPEDQRKEFMVHAAQLATLAMFSSGQTRKALEAQNVVEPLDCRKLLEAMEATK
jgi:hypothetical protein